MLSDPSEPVVLGFDTSGPWCAAALIRGDKLMAACHEDMARGQAERLMTLLEAMLAGEGLGWRNLGGLGVGVGPGNFTGIRIAVAAARGLALGLGVPAIGVTRFEALALDGPALPVLVSAGRGQAWLQAPRAAPRLVPAEAPGETVIADPAEFPALASSRAPAHAPAEAIALIAAARLNAPQPRPAPLYLRDADAAPSTEAAPVLLE